MYSSQLSNIHTLKGENFKGKLKTAAGFRKYSFCSIRIQKCHHSVMFHPEIRFPLAQTAFFNSFVGALPMSE